ncbi:MAG: Maf family protein [Gammaproteobacteria bacterium]|nr:Maf family protein [Gammaproteobacteria bacterium]
MLILASASARRRELLARLDLRFRVQPADVDETPRFGESPEALALRLARAKAGAIGADEPVLAADTVVAMDDEALGKPRDAREAESMLTRLSGREHRVVTALALRHAGVLDHATVVTRLWFRTLAARESQGYAARPEVLDAAGAYAIQHGAAPFLTRLVGSYSNVVGLPLAETAALLRLAGLKP